jgi:hypothetical protein
MKTFWKYLREVHETDAILQALPDDVYNKITTAFGGNEEQIESVLEQIAAYISTVSTNPKDFPQLWKRYENIRNATDAWRVYQQSKQAPMATTAARSLKPAGMSEDQIDNEIKSYLGNKESGLVKNLGFEIQREIESMRRSGALRSRMARNAGEARMKGTGIWFFDSPEGLAFIKIMSGIAPMSRPFGKY